MNHLFKRFLKLSLVVSAALPAISNAAMAGAAILVKGGGNLSKISYTGAGNGMGFQGGVGVDIGSMPMVGIEIDAMYAIRKTKIAAAAPSPAFTASATQLEFPVVVYWAPMPMVRILAGGFYSMGIGKIKLATTGFTVPDQAYAGFLKKGDYGATFGLGTVLPVGMHGIGIEARYNLGLANRNDSAGTTSLKSTSIDFNVAFRF